MSPTILETYEIKVINDAATAWKRIKQHRQYKDYMLLGQALAIGRRHIMRELNVNDTTSGKYRIAFSDWCKLHGFDDMDKSLRSDLLFLQEPDYGNIAAQLRSAMSDAEQRKISHPHAMVGRVRKYLKDLQDEPKRKAKDDLAAMAHEDELNASEPEFSPEHAARHYLRTGTVNDRARFIAAAIDDPDDLKTLIELLQEQLS